MENGSIGVLLFLITVGFNLFAFAVLLRFFLQWAKADFYNPLCQFLMKFTNPLLMPLRRIIPGFFGVDFAALVLTFLVVLVQKGLLIWIQSGNLPWMAATVPGQMAPWLVWIIISAVGVVKLIITLFIYLIIIRIIASWIMQGRYNPAITAVHQVTQPAFDFVYRFIRPTGGFDFAPMVLLIGLFCVQIFISGFGF